MTNSDKEELLSDLWREDEASLREKLLQDMIAESRHKRSQRRTIRAVLSVVAMIGCGLWLRVLRVPALTDEMKRPAFAEGSRRNETAAPLTIRHLTDAELRERLKGFAVAYVGPPGAQKILLLED